MPNLTATSVIERWTSERQPPQKLCILDWLIKHLGKRIEINYTCFREDFCGNTDDGEYNTKKEMPVIAFSFVLTGIILTPDEKFWFLRCSHGDSPVYLPFSYSFYRLVTLRSSAFRLNYAIALISDLGDRTSMEISPSALAAETVYENEYPSDYPEQWRREYPEGKFDEAAWKGLSGKCSADFLLYFQEGRFVLPGGKALQMFQGCIHITQS
jgi:hypothetical protein